MMEIDGTLPSPPWVRRVTRGAGVAVLSAVWVVPRSVGYGSRGAWPPKDVALLRELRPLLAAASRCTTGDAAAEPVGSPECARGRSCARGLARLRRPRSGGLPWAGVSWEFEGVAAAAETRCGTVPGLLFVTLDALQGDSWRGVWPGKVENQS